MPEPTTTDEQSAWEVALQVHGQLAVLTAAYQAEGPDAESAGVQHVVETALTRLLLQNAAIPPVNAAVAAAEVVAAHLQELATDGGGCAVAELQSVLESMRSRYPHRHVRLLVSGPNGDGERVVLAQEEFTADDAGVQLLAHRVAVLARATIAEGLLQQELTIGIGDGKARQA